MDRIKAGTLLLNLIMLVPECQEELTNMRRVLHEKMEDNARIAILNKLVQSSAFHKLFDYILEIPAVKQDMADRLLRDVNGRLDSDANADNAIFNISTMAQRIMYDPPIQPVQCRSTADLHLKGSGLQQEHIEISGHALSGDCAAQNQGDSIQDPLDACLMPEEFAFSNYAKGRNKRPGEFQFKVMTANEKANGRGVPCKFCRQRKKKVRHLHRHLLVI